MSPDLPSYIDTTKVIQLAALVLIVVQYFKTKTPKEILPYISLFIGVGLAFLDSSQSGGVINYPLTIIYGVLAGIAADTGYNFLSESKSSRFTLPSKSQIIEPKPKED